MPDGEVAELGAEFDDRFRPGIEVTPTPCEATVAVIDPVLRP